MFKKICLCLVFVGMFGCNSTSPEYDEPKVETPAPVVIKQTVVVLPNYYGDVSFERYYSYYDIYKYTPSGTISDGTYTGRYHIKYNQGSNNDVVMNLEGKEFYLVNMGKLPDQYFPNDRCSVAKFNDAGNYSELGVCQSGKTVFWISSGYIVFY